MAKKQDSVLFEMCELDCEGLVLELNMLGQLAGLQEGVQILLEVLTAIVQGEEKHAQTIFF